MASGGQSDDYNIDQYSEELSLLSRQVTPCESEEEETVTEEEDEEDDHDEDDVATSTPVYSPEVRELISELRATVRSQHGTEDFCFMNDPQWAPGEERPEEESDIEGRLVNTDWCHCQKCCQMKSVPESICCKEREELENLYGSGISCITEHPMFIERCISREQLIHTLYLIGTFQGRVQDVNANRSLRYAAYRSYTAWVHGHLGKHYRIPIPSCVVGKIRDSYPEVSGHYTGFRYYMEFVQNNVDADMNF